MVLHVQPITNLKTIAIYWKRLTDEGVSNKERNGLFWELVRTIVIGTPGDNDRQPVGAKIGRDQQVRRRLAGCIGAVWVEGAVLCKTTGWSKGTVHLIRRDLNHAWDAMPTARLQHDLCPEYIRFYEGPCILDASIDMRLSRKVDQRVEPILQQFVHQQGVADTPLDKTVSGIAFNICEVLEVAGVGQLVE